MLRTIWRKLLAERIFHSIEARSAPAIDAKIRAVEDRMSALFSAAEAAMLALATRSTADHAAMMDAVEAIRSDFRSLADSVRAHDHQAEAAARDQAAVNAMVERLDKGRPELRTQFVPPIGLATPTPGSFMEWSTCSAADFIRPEFASICADLGCPTVYHRKIWEWVFIVHHLRRLGMPVPGNRGLAFGVGTEALPSLFGREGAEIVATDAPGEIGAQWAETREFAAKLDDLRAPSIIDEATFRRRVSYATCDMNAIGAEFTGFDFCWSSCCYEHLGTLQAGLDFVVNSVEKTLRPGGVACHTTEFNLSSNDATVESGATVIYRKRDIEQLVQRLRDRGHEVDTFRVAPDQHPFDFYVDVPPYMQNPHLRLDLLGYTSTSIGLVIRRGSW